MKTIPKICFLYWNNAPMSFLHTVTVLSFHKYNPDWEIIVYNFIFPDEPIHAPKYVHYNGEDHFNNLRDLQYIKINDIRVEKKQFHSILISDLWRRGILYENGGVYSDFDVIWLKPVSHLKNVECLGNPEDFTSIVSYYDFTKEFHNVSILISEKASEFDSRIIEAQKQVTNPYDDQAFGTTLLNWMFPTWESIDIKRMLALKYETFYPYSTYDLAKLYLENNLTPIEKNNVIAVHWFNGNPLSKMFINNSLYKTDCSVNSILKREGYVES